MGKKRETFAEILAAAPEPLEQEVEYLHPIGSGEPGWRAQYGLVRVHACGNLSTYSG
jgi:hypothetical protein